VLICGASFAGLAVARELAGTGAHVLVVDRYEIGERQTSACGIPTGWLQALELMGSHRQEFGELVIHSPHATARYQLPWSFSTFDYRELCALLAQQGSFEFETAKVEGPPPANSEDMHVVKTDRGEIRAPLVVDALGWRRVLGRGAPIQPPDAYLSRGLEVHPHGRGEELEIWIDRRYVPAGYGWSFPAGDELRIGVGSFDPRFHVKDPTVALARDLERDPSGYQGNWIPHRIREATEGGIFFVGDSAGHCLPLTAEGIRTAFYFGIACGRELADVVAGRQSRAAALARYGAFSAAHRWQYEWMLRVQRLIPRVPPRVLGPALTGMSVKRFVDWSFSHYLAIAHPDYVSAHGDRARAGAHLAASQSPPMPASTASGGSIA
jgi:flavin-dependent dehydrogenase